MLTDINFYVFINFIVKNHVFKKIMKFFSIFLMLLTILFKVAGNLLEKIINTVMISLFVFFNFQLLLLFKYVFDSGYY